MTEREPQPKQTTPKGKEIPMPKKADVMRDLRKVAKRKPSRDDAKR